MIRNQIAKWTCAGCLCLMLGWISLTIARAQPQPAPADPQQQQRLDALRRAGSKASLTIYPPRVLERPDARVAEVLAVILEKNGMDRLDISDAAFAAQGDAQWDARATAFADQIKQDRIGTDYALYAEYLGTPKTGPTEVRFVVADAAGRTVLIDRQTPADADFQRTAKRDPDPLGCTILVVERLKPILGLKERAGHTQGRFARNWARKTGLPDATERAEMNQRRDALSKDLANTGIQVFSTQIATKPDSASAGRLAIAVKALGCSATPSDRALSASIAPTSNQQKRLWDMARALRDELRKTPADAEYVLLAEFGMNPAGGEVGFVNTVLCNRTGDWVLVDFQNNQHDDFQRIAPKTAADCERLVVARLERLLK